MAQFFNIIFYQPILNLLILIYNILPGHDLGLAIIILTIIIRLIFWPLSQKALASQRALQAIQPKIKALQEKYKDNKERLAQEIMEVYRQSKVNPLSSFFILLIQLPILIAVYQVFRRGLAGGDLALYPFIHHPGNLNLYFLGLFNLAKPNLILAILTGIFQYWQTKMLTTKLPPDKISKTEGAKDESLLAIMNRQMNFLMPVFTVFIGLTLPSSIMLYWLVGLILTIIQQKFILKKE
jgi:YidC/Oxa1 family membrane protein insertase